MLLFKLICKKQLSWDNSPCCTKFSHFFYIARKILECDKLHLFLLMDEIQTDKKEYLQSLETTRDLSYLHRWTDTKKCLSVLT